MSSPTVTETVSFLPAAVGDSVTLGPDTTAGIKDVCVDLTNLPAGTIMTVSCQKIHTSGGSYYESQNATFSNPVAVPAAPGAGYEPLQTTEPELSPYGYQAVITLVSGTLPTTAITITLESV